MNETVSELGDAGLGTFEGERVLLRCRPSWWFIVLHNRVAIVGLTLLGLMAAWATPLAGGAVAQPARVSLLLLAMAIGLLLLVNTLNMLTRTYMLTERRVLALRGILDRYHVDIPLERVQSTEVLRPFIERVFGVGTIVFSSAGLFGSAVSWRIVSDPDDLLGEARRLMRAQAVGETGEAQP